MSRSPEHMVTNYKGAEISYSRLFLLSPRPMELRPPPRWDHNTISVSGCPGSWLSQYQGSCRGSEDRMSPLWEKKQKIPRLSRVTQLWLQMRRRNVDHLTLLSVIRCLCPSQNKNRTFVRKWFISCYTENHFVGLHLNFQNRKTFYVPIQMRVIYNWFGIKQEGENRPSVI